MPDDFPFASSALCHPEIDTTVSHSARIWDYWLGGKDNYPVDREVGDRIEELLPDIVKQAREDRLFLGRVVRYLAGEAGVRQFLDIGTGLPTVDNTHEVAQRRRAESRIVYVDNDPLVLVHARALLTSSPEGATDYIHADLHDPGAILAGAAQTLDFGQPVAVTMLGVLWHVLDDDEATRDHRPPDRRPCPPGSYLALNHPTLEVTGEKMATAISTGTSTAPAGTYSHPRRTRPVLRRARAGRARRGLDHALAARGFAVRRAEEIDQFGAVGRKP